jgi:hypothetical protein
MPLPRISPGLILGGVLFVVFFVTWWIWAANISDDRAVHAAKALGLSDIHVDDSAIWFIEFSGCADDDMKQWTVSGTNAQGQRVTITVCAGFWKGATVRSN